jgi:hypothetical protein
MEKSLGAGISSDQHPPLRQGRRTDFDSALFSVRFPGHRFAKQIGQSPNAEKVSKFPYAIALPDAGIKLRNTFCAATEASTPGTPRRARSSRKAIARGMP